MTTPQADERTQGAPSPEKLASLLFAVFPANATDWDQATDEVRDMCRAARELAGAPDTDSVNFRALSTPSQWNSKGVAATVAFYGGLSEARRQEFCERFGHWFALERTELGAHGGYITDTDGVEVVNTEIEAAEAVALASRAQCKAANATAQAAGHALEHVFPWGYRSTDSEP